MDFRASSDRTTNVNETGSFAFFCIYGHECLPRVLEAIKLENWPIFSILGPDQWPPSQLITNQSILSVCCNHTGRKPCSFHHTHHLLTRHEAILILKLSSDNHKSAASVWAKDIVIYHGYKWKPERVKLQTYCKMMEVHDINLLHMQKVYRN